MGVIEIQYRIKTIKNFIFIQAKMSMSEILRIKNMYIMVNYEILGDNLKLTINDIEKS